MDWTPIIVAIISGVVSSFTAILVFIGNEKARKQKAEEFHAAQLKSTEDSIKELLNEHREEYINGLDKITNRINELEDNFTNLQATYQQTSAIVSLKIDALEKKQDVHNNLITRMYEVESSIKLHGEQIKVANHRIEDLEKNS